jgi:hypothetical protein
MLNHYPVIIFNSSNDAAERSTGGIVQAGIGGLLTLVDARKISAPLSPNIARVRPDHPDQIYASVASSQGACIVQVSADASDALIGFMNDCPGTIQDFQVVILSTTPEKEAQARLIETLDALTRAGMTPAQIRLFAVQAPANQSFPATYPLLASRLEKERYVDIPPAAVLPESSAFSRVVDHQLAVAAVLNGEIDFDILLREARERGSDERELRDLSTKLLAQRSLLARRNDITGALEQLQFPGMSKPEVIQSDLTEAAAT